MSSQTRNAARQEYIQRLFEMKSEAKALEEAKLEMLKDAAESLAIIADALQEINARQALNNITGGNAWKT